ncbi:MAG: hypothetical protein ACXVCP_07465 [Bdellovibrio sp.]
MNNQIFKLMLAVSLTGGLTSSTVHASEMSKCSDSQMNCLIFLPTLIPVTALMAVLYPFYGSYKMADAMTKSCKGRCNEAVMAAQEPAYMVLNSEPDALENPLFQDAVKELKKANVQIEKAGNQEMAALILTLGQYDIQDETNQK